MHRLERVRVNLSKPHTREKRPTVLTEPATIPQTMISRSWDFALRSINERYCEYKMYKDRVKTQLYMCMDRVKTQLYTCKDRVNTQLYTCKDRFNTQLYTCIKDRVNTQLYTCKDRVNTLLYTCKDRFNIQLYMCKEVRVQHFSKQGVYCVC